METFKITTDETLRETIQHGNNRYPFAYYPDNIWKFDFHRIDWHWHHELEFLYIAEGTALCLIGTSKIELHKGCGIFINSGVLHRFEAQSSTFAPNIVFSPTLLAPENSLIYEKYILPVISSSVPYQVFSPSNTFGKQVLQLLSQICTIQETKPDNELCTIQLLFQLWNILQKNMDWTSDSNSIHRLNHKQARLQAMMQYIHDHYMEEITLETIAASASISKSGALHIFQTGIHCSPVAYLIQYRLAQAAEQLYITQKSVSSIAEETGFTSSGYFCRKFRQYYHMSPNEYRKKKTEEISKFLLSVIIQYLEMMMFFRYIICIHYVDNILFMHHIYNVQKIEVFYMQTDRFINFIYLFAILIISSGFPPAFHIPSYPDIYYLYQ